MAYVGKTLPAPMHEDFLSADPMTASNDPAPGGMTDEEFKQFLSAEVKDALSYIDSEIAGRRDTNYKYFDGVMEDMPTEDGRSKVVDTVIADHVGFMMPAILRVMFSGKIIGEYQPTGLEDEDACKLATSFVNEVVLRRDNDIERVGYGWLFDALVNILGVVKVWWEEDIETEDQPLQGLPDDQFAMLVNQLRAQPSGAQVRYDIVDHAEQLAPYPGSENIPGGPVVVSLHSVVIRKTVDNSRIKFDVIPPEEFVVSRDARDIEDAVLKSHRTTKRAGDLIAMGFDPEFVASLPEHDDNDRAPEGSTRRSWDVRAAEASRDPMMREIAVHDGVIKCDKDGTGIKEWYFVAAGRYNAFEVLKCQPYEHQIAFCDFTPQPIPHSIWGKCTADDLVQIQRIKTNLSRGILDNINLSNMPQREVLVSGILDRRLEYVQNVSPGGIIPVTTLGAVREVSIPFVADKALLVSQYYEDRAESRTGVSRASAGLEADRLQNQAPTVALLNDNNSKARQELVARIWATGGMRKLFRIILRMLKKYHTYDRVVRLMGRATRVSPQQWAAFGEWDVTINTGLGTGSRERDLQMISLVLQQQKEVLQNLGPNNPICTLGQFTNALHKACETAGFANSEQYFNELPLDYAPPPQEPQPPPEVQKAAIDAGTKQAKAILDGQIKIQTEAMKAAVKREENMADVELRIREQNIEAILGKYQIDKKASTDQAANIKRS